MNIFKKKKQIKPKPKFSYNEQIIITDGFYKGQKGKLISVYWDDEDKSYEPCWIYTIEITNTGKSRPSYLGGDCSAREDEIKSLDQEQKEFNKKVEDTLNE